MKFFRTSGALALAFVMFDSSAATLEVSEQDQQMLGIRTEVVERVQDAPAQVLNMRVAFSPDALWVIRSALPGLLTQVNVREGDRVEPGQALATLRSTELVALQQEFLEALAEFDVAGTALTRDQLLLEAGAISKRRWQDTLYAHAAARARLSGLEGQLLAAGMDADELESLAGTLTISPDLLVRAPAQGLVLARDVNPGTRVDESETLMRLGDPQKLILEALLSPAAAATLAPGMRLRAVDGQAGAVIEFLSSVVDPNSQTVSVRAVPDNASELRPGELSAWAVLEKGDTLVVPPAAVVRLNEADIVYVAVTGGFEERVIEARSTATGVWIVYSGLDAGERIAVQGTAALKGLSLGMGGGD